jgi:glyoxylase-like metal-dependent hydrolase (beta-lactamase superfamily II)
MVDATVEIVDRGRMEMDRNLLVQSAVTSTHSDPDPSLQRTTIPIYSLVVDHPDATVLIDTGSHHAAGEGHWPRWLFEIGYQPDAADHRLDEDLAAAGYDIAEVDAVVMSHLHLDHAGGLEFFDGRDVPIYVHRRELEYAWFSAATPQGVGNIGYVRADFDHHLQWHPIERDRRAILPGVELIHLPGHSPGLLGTLLELDDHGHVLHAGDAAHLAENYDREIPPGGGLLENEDDWRRSLRRVKHLASRHDADVLIGHDTDQLASYGDGWV